MKKKIYALTYTHRNFKENYTRTKNKKNWKLKKKVSRHRLYREFLTSAKLQEKFMYFKARFLYFL